MLRVIIGAVLVAASLAASAGEQPVASENANAMAIARGNACMGCHAVDRKLVGPSFQQVAEKYKGQHSSMARFQELTTWS